jgi:hypothetical protein
MATWQGWVVLAGAGSAVGSVRIVDARLSGSPAAGSVLEDLGSASVMARSGPDALVADGQSVWHVDMAAPDIPVLRGQRLLPGSVSALALDGPHGFAAWSNSGLAGDPAGPEHGLDLFHPAVPSAAVEGSRLPLASRVETMIAAGPWAYVVAGKQLLVVEARDPTAPGVARSLALADYADRMVLVGHALFVGGHGERLARFDLSEPGRPIPGPSIELGGWIHEIAASADRLVATLETDTGMQLAVFDPADGGSWPAPVARLPIPWPGAQRLAADERRAYLDTEAGLHIIDLVDPAKPRLLDHRSLRFPVADLLPLGHRLAVAAGGGGLRVLRVP